MKDALIGFIVALVLGSMYNEYQSQTHPQGAESNGSSETSQSPGIPLSSINDANFKAEVLDQPQPVLVDFYTQTCPHCKNMTPVLGQIAQEYSGSLKVVKMDVMDNPLIANKYSVNGVPAFILFDKGAAIESFVGEMPKSKLLSRIKPHLNSSERPSESPAAGTG